MKMVGCIHRTFARNRSEGGFVLALVLFQVFEMIHVKFESIHRAERMVKVYAPELLETTSCDECDVLEI